MKKSVYISFWETLELATAINAFCEAAGITRSDFIRCALRRALIQDSWPLNEKPKQETK